MDGIELPFENVLNYDAFSVRIAEADVPKLPAILRGLSSSKVETLQKNLARVRSRFGYSSLARNEIRIAESTADSSAGYLKQLMASNEHQEDALQTVLRILLLRAAQRSRTSPK